MSIDPPAYIISLQNNIRARPISWEGAVRAKTITDADLKKIKSIDKVRKEQRKQVIEADLDGFSTLFLGAGNTQSIFQAAAKREDIIQYLLVLLSDLIDDIEPFTSTLMAHNDPYKPLLPLLKQSSNTEDPIPLNTEDPIPLLTASVVASLISHTLNKSTKTPTVVQEAIPKLDNYLSTLATSSDSGLQDIAVQAYSAILRTRKSREIFWSERASTLNPLVEILRAAAGVSGNGESTLYNGRSSIRTAQSDTGLSGGVGIQLLYHVLMVFWQLSFEADMVGQGLDEEHDLVPLYTQLLRISPKEKITRLLLSTLRNLFAVPANQPFFFPAAALARLPALLVNLKSRHLTDEDLVEDLDAIKSMLDDYNSSQTTFSEYASEVRAGHLRWSPPHRSAPFWAENARRILEENKGELPRKLAEVLAKSWDTDKQVLAIGCNDVGWLVKECPEKKAQMEKMGLKSRVMELMQADDESVRWEALRAVGEWLRYSFDA